MARGGPPDLGLSMELKTHSPPPQKKIETIYRALGLDGFFG
jgi:hypothetical protein